MRRLTLALAAALIAATVAAQSVPELFQKVKDQVKAGSWKDALATMDAVDLEAGRPANQKFQPQLEAPLAFYRGVCDANLDRVDAAGADFETFLLLQPDATIDQTLYSAKAVAAFEQAKAGMTASKPSLSRAYRQFPPAPPAAMSQPVTADWGKGPVIWLMSDGEKAAWAKLKGDPERVAFVEAFWRAREPANDHFFRAIFERRVAFADAELGQGRQARRSRQHDGSRDGLHPARAAGIFEGVGHPEIGVDQRRFFRLRGARLRRPQGGGRHFQLQDARRQRPFRPDGKRGVALGALALPQGTPGEWNFVPGSHRAVLVEAGRSRRARAQERAGQRDPGRREEAGVTQQD